MSVNRKRNQKHVGQSKLERNQNVVKLVPRRKPKPKELVLRTAPGLVSNIYFSVYCRG
jgi:hypothetical protein